MPKKSGKEADVSVSPAGDKRGGRSRLESTIPSDAGQLSSPHGASHEAESSVSPEKGVLGRRQNATRGEAGAAAALEGPSWKGQAVAPAGARKNAARGTKEEAADAGLSNATFAQVSAGRPSAAKRALPLGRGQAATRASATSVKAPQKAAPASSQRVASVSRGEGAPPSLSVDQQTQDLAGQEAAPTMHFKVNVGMCGVCLCCQMCICCRGVLTCLHVLVGVM